MAVAQPWLIVGLGNPGREYQGHRHNVGHAVVDGLTEQVGGRLRRHKRAKALALETRIGDVRAVLAEPTTYMNDSGDAVAALVDFYKVPTDQIVVVHDELDLPFGALRLKIGGGDNGHNGLRSIRRSLSTGEYGRVRIGIGRPPGRLDAAVFVLRDFAAGERKELPSIVERAVDATTSLVTEGLATAQNRYND